MAHRITDQDTYRTPGRAMNPDTDKRADLCAGLNAAVEAGLIEGWHYAYPRSSVDEWVVTLTTEQARALVVKLSPRQAEQ